MRRDEICRGIYITAATAKGPKVTVVNEPSSYCHHRQNSCIPMQFMTPWRNATQKSTPGCEGIAKPVKPGKGKYIQVKSLYLYLRPVSYYLYSYNYFLFDIKMIFDLFYRLDSRVVCVTCLLICMLQSLYLFKLVSSFLKFLWISTDFDSLWYICGSCTDQCKHQHNITSVDIQIIYH